jgi:molybdenum cofactor cytidylyltransferase
LVAAILAAGRSTRMGKDKLLLPLGERPLVAQVVEAVTTVRPQEILVIVNADNAAAIASAVDAPGVRIVVNPRATQGMGTSIACAAASLPDATDALIVLQGDQPLVSAEAMRQLAERFRTAGKAYVAARYGRLVTTPVVFARSVFAELCTLEGDRGARRILERHRDDGDVVDLPAWMALDADDPDGYRRLLERWRQAD